MDTNENHHPTDFTIYKFNAWKRKSKWLQPSKTSRLDLNIQKKKKSKTLTKRWKVAHHPTMMVEWATHTQGDTYELGPAASKMNLSYLPSPNKRMEIENHKQSARVMSRCISNFTTTKTSWLWWEMAKVHAVYWDVANETLLRELFRHYSTVVRGKKLVSLQLYKQLLKNMKLRDTES